MKKKLLVMLLLSGLAQQIKSSEKVPVNFNARIVTTTLCGLAQPWLLGMSALAGGAAINSLIKNGPNSENLMGCIVTYSYLSGLRKIENLKESTRYSLGDSSIKQLRNCNDAGNQLGILIATPLFLAAYKQL